MFIKRLGHWFRLSSGSSINFQAYKYCRHQETNATLGQYRPRSCRSQPKPFCLTIPHTGIYTMSDEKEMHTSPVYPTPSQAPPPAPAPVYPVPVPAQVPPVYPTPVHPVYPASVPAPVPAKVETPYTYPTTTVPPPPVPVSVPVAPVSGKQYQDQGTALNADYNPIC